MAHQPTIAERSPASEAIFQTAGTLRSRLVTSLESISIAVMPWRSRETPVAIEFFNSDALNLLRRARATYSGFSELPAIPTTAHTAIYIELHGDSEETLEEQAMAAIEAAADLGASEEDSWCATTTGEMEKLKAFRHATPEAVNLLIKTTTESSHIENAIPYSVEVASLDHPGIVNNIASFFSERNINIVNLHTESYSAPHTGTPMFALHMTIGISADTNIAQLRDAFMQVCDELNLDAELKNL